jgi:predicted phage tail component-like protein
MRASKLKINGVYTDEYKVKPKNRIEIPTPEQDVEYKEIRGRNGTLTRKYGFKNIPLPVHFTIHQESFKKTFRKAKMYLFNAKTLSFDDDDEVHYKVKSVQIDTAENIVEKFGEFTVNFILDPFQYETNPIQTITSSTTLNNQGYESEPYIKCFVSGTGKIYIGEQVITIKGVNGTIEIDSAMMNAYRNESGLITNLNNKMIGDFPVLVEGNNRISFDGDITKLEINPRWRWI